jgi:dipeptidyl aminopeptidase/acylaminoacyl peptidase
MADVLTLAALRALVSFSEPRLSPDAARVAYVRTTRDRRNDRMAHELVVVRSDGIGTRTVDAGPFVGSPRWSPDGTRLAYLRHTAKHDEDQIVVVRLATGTQRVVTRAPQGVQQFAWSPDGRRIAYVTPDPEPNAAAAKRHDDLFELGEDGFLTDKPIVPSHLWLQPADGGRARRLTHGTWSVYEGVAPFVGGPSDPSWSPDGHTILITRAPDQHDAVTDRSWPAAVDVTTGAVRDLGTARRYVYAPMFEPAGDRYAYLKPHGPGPISVIDAFVAPRAGGDGVDRTAALDRDLQTIRWAGDTLIATATDGMRQAIVAIAPDGSARRVDVGSLSVDDVDAAKSGALAFVASSSTRPPEVYVMPSAHARPRALTDANARLRRMAFGRVETLRWTAPDGMVSEGLLVHPVHERAGVKYPLVIWHHGGPEAAINTGFTEGTDENWPIGQLAAARGWYAFLPNYRGSDDLGTAHEHAIYEDPGAGPMSDVMAGLETIERRGTIDTSRECVGGHSYGGDMTAWIIGHDARWRCAVLGDAAVDWIEAYDLSGNGNLAWSRDSLGGSPWQSAAMLQRYREDSPVTYASQVRTPTLILTGLADQVVPFSEAWEFYHALRDNHVPVHLVGIPTAHHTPRDPVRLESYQQRILDWFAQNLR